MSIPPLLHSRIQTILIQADGLVITAGAGMGVDSGLPDFRGTEGFWKAYPALGRAGMRFEEVASPRTFESDSRLAWGFYGHRLLLYRRTHPHDGFTSLLRAASRYPRQSFVFTSNVDGQFTLAGFPEDRIVECHGAIHHMQCFGNCGREIWSSEEFSPEVDRESARLLSELPLCPRCRGLARPNILMFDDNGWNPDRTRDQMSRWSRWKETVRRLVVIEIGAGRSVPTVRLFGESLGAPLIRINPNEPETSRPGDISLRMGAREGISLITAAMEGPDLPSGSRL